MARTLTLTSFSVMTRSRWLWLAAACGIAIFALSFVPGWIAHDRELRGEGYRYVQIHLSAWRAVAIPVTSMAALGALIVGVASALVATRRLVLPSWPLVIGAAIVVALIAASAWPLMNAGHASTIRLAVGWALPVALLAALGMLLGLVAATRPSRRVLVAAGVLAVLALVAGIGGRALGLDLAQGTGQHWEVGSYTREATGGEPTETMTLDGERYVIGERWSGTWESSGWTVSLDNDPACPESRGTYHARGVGEEDLRFVKVVDTCRDGARAADLETGTWERDP